MGINKYNSEGCLLYTSLYPDLYMKCGHCGAEVGIIKTE